MKATKERFQTEEEELKSYYKYVCRCTSCQTLYGRDSDRPQEHELCPFCERDNYMPRGAKKKDEEIQSK